jgi:hypothetical protein
MPKRTIAFRRIAQAALSNSVVIVTRSLPDGRREGREWVAGPLVVRGGRCHPSDEGTPP